jgi:hypothetical protein
VKNSRTFAAFVCLSLCTVVCPSPSFAQQLSPAQKAQLKYYLALESRLTPEQRQLLSRPVLDSITLAHEVFDPPDQAGGNDDNNLLLGLLASSGSPVNNADLSTSASVLDSFSGSLQNSATGVAVLDQRGLTKISHPENELQFSRLGGFSDIQSSSARCGQNIVTAYRSGLASTASALLPFLANPQIFPAASTLGVAYSTDGGDTFTALPFLSAGPPADPSQPEYVQFSVGGNASAGCSSSQRFYVVSSPYSVDSLTKVGNDGGANEVLLLGAGISISSDGGQTWADPTPAVLRNFNHLVDSAWLAIDPQNPDRLYISYLDIDFSFSDPLVPLDEGPRCPDTFLRIASELVSSSDAGRTWSSPSIIREDCLPPQPSGAQGFHVGSTRIVVGADGKVSAAYVLFVPVTGPDGITVVDYKIEVRVRQSSNHGRSFGRDVKVSNLVQIGEASHSFRPVLQGFFAPGTIPVLAADPAKRGKTQSLYIAWADGRDNPQPDAAAPFGTYNYGDIVLSRSTDGGATWSPPRAVSPTPKDFKGAGRDQFLPSIAVDANGAVAVCYYDRRNDPDNNGMDRYCSISQDGGQAFHDVRQSSKTWTYGENWDRFGSWLGDYDTVTAPSSPGRGEDFFGSFGISGDEVTGIFGRSIQREQ